MANVYSTRLWAAQITSASVLTGPSVPTGYIWVARHCVVQSPVTSDFMGSAGQFYIRDQNNFDVYAIYSPDYVNSQHYAEEMRVVLPTGYQLFALSSTFPMRFVLSGYQLSTP